MEKFKLWPVSAPNLVKVKNKGADIEIHDNSILFGYTIRIPNHVYDNSLKCSRAFKIINDNTHNQHGYVFRQTNGRCYFKLTKREPFRLVKNFYSSSGEILTGLKQSSMIKTRQLKELCSESERTSLENGEMTTKQVKQLRLHLDNETSVELPF